MMKANCKTPGKYRNLEIITSPLSSNGRDKFVIFRNSISKFNLTKNIKTLRTFANTTDMDDDSHKFKKIASDVSSLSKEEKNKIYLKSKREKIVIFAKNMETSSNSSESLKLIRTGKNLNKKDYDFLKNIISNHLFFQALSSQKKDELIESLNLNKFEKGETLYEQGTNSEYWCIVYEGTLECYVNNETSKVYSKGDSFGEMDLAGDLPTSMTVKSIEECKLWILKKSKFTDFLTYLTSFNYNKNARFLNKIQIPFNYNTKTMLSSNLLLLYYKKNEYIYKKMERSNWIFIIKEGNVEIKDNEHIINILEPGNFFGHVSILKDRPREYDAKARTDCQVYAFSKEILLNQQGPGKNMQELLNTTLGYAFLKSNYFKNVNLENIKKASSLFNFKFYEKNDIVLSRQDDNLKDKIIVLLDGEIGCKKYETLNEKSNTILFEHEIFNKEKIQIDNNYIAIRNCLICTAKLSAFQKIIGEEFFKGNKDSTVTNEFNKNSIFKLLSNDKKRLVTNNLNTEKFDDEQIIISQGEKKDKFYIIKKGKVEVYIDGKYIRSLSEGEDFGAKALLFKNTKRSATVVAKGSCECYYLNSDVFDEIIDSKLVDYFNSKFPLEDNSIELDDLENIKDLGHGTFGFVNLVRNIKTQQLYSIKAIDLDKIERYDLQVNVENERNVLLKINHPFIMKMVKYLKNENYVFFLNEYIRGKELWQVIRDIGLLNKQQSQFYSASLFLAIHYLHQNKIIYRDLKPENIMITEKGYIKIIDFGSAKEIKDKTNTIIGTTHYMAPEVITGQNYSFKVDMWSIAVCMYEFVCGTLPFGENYKDPIKVKHSILNDDLVFPSFVKDFSFKTLIMKMLKKKSSQRLYKFNEIKNDNYFFNFNWNKLLNMTLEPPYKFEIGSYESKCGKPYLSFLETKTLGNVYNSHSKEFDSWFKNF